MSYIPYPRPAGDFRTSYRADAPLFHSAGDKYFMLAAAAFALTVPLWGGTYVTSQLILIGVYGIAAVGLNVLVGNTGQISLGHGAFFGFGAFSSAYISNTWGVPVMLAIPLAGLMTTVIGLIFGIPAARLKGLYLAIATLASQFIIEDFLARAEWFSGGPYGSPAETPMLFGFAFDDDQTYFYLVFFWLTLSILAVTNLLRTRDGRALVAVRDHYLSAEIMGVNLAKYRVLSFGVSSFFAGLAGALFGHYLGFVSAEGFSILLSVQFLAMIIIGGLGSVTGAMMGTVFILMLPQVTELAAGAAAGIFPALARGAPYIKEMSVGAAIVLFLVFEPEGLIHRWRLMRASLKLFPFSH